MDITSNSLWIAGVAVFVLITTVIVRRTRMKKRAAAQYRADESLIVNTYKDFNHNELNDYKDLPDRQSRLKWLKRHFPEFVSAAERHYKDDMLIGAVAVHLDFQFLHGLTSHTPRERAITTYQGNSANISLREFQERLDVSNEETARRRVVEQLALAKHRANLAAKQQAEKVTARAYWDSLTSAEQSAFKRAKGKSDRKKAMVAPVSNGHSVETLYPLIMLTEFSGVSSDNNNSIDFCESPSYSHSSSDGGSSYSDGGSSSSCDGGGGGGGE